MKLLGDSDSSVGIDVQKVRLPLLTALNYFMWSEKLEVVLKSKGLWAIVNGIEKEPGLQDPGYDKHARRRDTALSTILLLVHDSCVAPIMEMTEPSEVWRTLKSQYQSVSQVSRDALLDKYQSMKMSAEESVLQYRARLEELESTLIGIGYSIDDREKLRALLRGLREEFQVTAEVIRGMEKNLPDAVALLISKEAFVQKNVSARDGARALNVRSSSSRKRKIKCHYCGRFNHKKADCYDNPESPKYRPKHRVNESSENKDAGGADSALHVARALVAGITGSSGKWFVDSGATEHMCNESDAFISGVVPSSKVHVEIGDGTKLDVKGKGTVPCIAIVTGKPMHLNLTEVQLLPNLRCNLLSVSSLQRKGYNVLFVTDKGGRRLCKVCDPKSKETVLVVIGNHEHGVYEVVMRPSLGLNPNTALITASVSERTTLWHNRIGHICAAHLRATVPLVDGVGLTKICDWETCESCHMSKSVRDVRLRVNRDQCKEPGELVHSDVVGPVKCTSFGGANYYVTLYDEFSAYSLVRFMNHRSEVQASVREMIVEFEAICQKPVRAIRMDNAKEYLSHELQNWLKQRGILSEPAAPYSLESNGKAERLNRTLNNAARAMLYNLPEGIRRERLWAEAVSTANFLRNRTFSSALTTGKTPFEAVCNMKTKMSHIRIFGCTAYIHIPKKLRSGKFVATARKGVLVGFESGNSYKVFYPESGSFVISRDVKFDERSFGWKTENGNEDAQESLDLDSLFDDLEYGTEEIDMDVPFTKGDLGEGSTGPEGEDRNPTESDVLVEPPLRRSSRQRSAPLRYSPESFIANCLLGITDNNLPQSFEQAMQSPEIEQWWLAMAHEVNNLRERDVIELVTCPPHVVPIDCRWVFGRKRNSCGVVTVVQYIPAYGRW